MNLKNKNYMKQTEFKAWKGSTQRQKTENTTLPLPFDRINSHREWARRAVQICFNV
jgi:hypothetical protein